MPVLTQRSASLIFLGLRSAFVPVAASSAYSTRFFSDRVDYAIPSSILSAPKNDAIGRLTPLFSTDPQYLLHVLFDMSGDDRKSFQGVPNDVVRLIVECLYGRKEYAMKKIAAANSIRSMFRRSYDNLVRVRNLSSEEEYQKQESDLLNRLKAVSKISGVFSQGRVDPNILDLYKPTDNGLAVTMKDNIAAANTWSKGNYIHLAIRLAIFGQALADLEERQDLASSSGSNICLGLDKRTNSVYRCRSELDDVWQCVDENGIERDAFFNRCISLKDSYAQNREEVKKELHRMVSQEFNSTTMSRKHSWMEDYTDSLFAKYGGTSSSSIPLEAYTEDTITYSMIQSAAEFADVLRSRVTMDDLKFVFLGDYSHVFNCFPEVDPTDIVKRRARTAPPSNIIGDSASDAATDPNTIYVRLNLDGGNDTIPFHSIMFALMVWEDKLPVKTKDLLLRNCEDTRSGNIHVQNLMAFPVPSPEHLEAMKVKLINAAAETLLIE